RGHSSHIDSSEMGAPPKEDLLRLYGMAVCLVNWTKPSGFKRGINAGEVGTRQGNPGMGRAAGVGLGAEKSQPD
ncbi:hypothetical protein E4U28_001632, partial [Claviceps purpurea]